MGPAEAAELMGAMGLLGTAWGNCGLDIFRRACCMWKLEAAVKGLTVVLPGAWLLRFGIPWCCQEGFWPPMAADTLGTCGLAKPEFRVPLLCCWERPELPREFCP